MADDPSFSLPDSRELRRLPRWAQVAFAARNARRVQSLFQGPDTTVEFSRAIDAAITLAEASAREGGINEIKTLNVADVADAAARASAHTRNSHASQAAMAAYSAASAVSAATAADAADIKSGADASNSVAAAYSAYAPAAAAARYDLEVLLAMARRENWTNATPVDVNVLGPLWYGNEPDWWPEESLAISNKPPMLHFEFTVPVDMPKGEADRLIGEILQRANELHHSMGGTGLTITDAEVYETEPSLVPAGCDDDRGDGR